ncbi:MAG TPA: hypothetical protein VIN10_10920 [Bacteroidales bacterium]
MAEEKNSERQQLFSDLIKKAELKQKVFSNTFESFRLFKKSIDKLTAEYEEYYSKHPVKRHVPFEARMRGDYEIEVKFGGDILLFLMHTNVFEFSRDHAVMRTGYIREEKDRSYCGVINIYNFLSDSFKYNRINDVGYMIGRVFINKDKHYFIEGKRELGFIYNNFENNIIDSSSVEKLIEAAVAYTINFDLLTPPYEQMKEVTVSEMKNTLDAISLKTGKRLGFQFQADKPDEEK